jgi:hypothetical protein
MRTSGILTLGGGIIAFLGAVFTLVMLKAFFVDRGQGFVDVTGILLGGAVLAIGASGVIAGRKRARLERENDDRGFAETAEALARRSGGQVKLDAVCKATGLSTDDATAKLRALTGKGLFDLDFDGNGQMVYKLSDSASQGQLAQRSV